MEHDQLSAAKARRRQGLHAAVPSADETTVSGDIRVRVRTRARVRVSLCRSNVCRVGELRANEGSSGR